MALVAANLSRDQALQQEVGQHAGAAEVRRLDRVHALTTVCTPDSVGHPNARLHDDCSLIYVCATVFVLPAVVLSMFLLQAPTAGVVEFGDAEDEPDYTQLAHKQQQRRQQQHSKQQGGTSATAATAATNPSKGGKHSNGRSSQQQQQGQEPKQQLAQHKAGELTHAEPNVPAESRLQLFGPADAAPGITDDSSWQGLGLSEVLAAHLEALNFQEPTQVCLLCLLVKVKGTLSEQQLSPRGYSRDAAAQHWLQQKLHTCFCKLPTSPLQLRSEPTVGMFTTLLLSDTHRSRSTASLCC
jgi:hypothetical protein